MAEAGPFVEWPDVDREGLKRNRKKVHSIEHLYHQTLVRDYPLHLERPTAVNKAIRSMHHFVLLKLVINDDGSVDAIIQHLNQPAFGGAIALFTVTVTNQPYIKERLIKDIDEGLYIVEHDVIDTENVHFRAALTIDRKGYVLGWYNCEAYAEFLMTGTAHSYQTMEESSPGKDVAVAAFHEFQNLLATLIRSLTSSSGVNIVHSDTGHSDTSAIATLFPGPEKVYYVLYRQLIGHSDRS
uniref:Uncharacterized protein n=1 Tax=Plectus sambesii TaxID=2011161 RepID=A0A914X067_9BILA